MKKLGKLTLKELENSVAVMQKQSQMAIVAGSGNDPYFGSGFSYQSNGGYGGFANPVSFNGTMTNMLPEVNVIVDGPNTTLMSFNDFANSCKSSYNSLAKDAFSNIAKEIFPATKVLFDVASTFDNVSAIANQNTNIQILQNIANTGNAQGDVVNLSVTRTANNVTVYTTSGDSIYSSYGK